MTRTKRKGATLDEVKRREICALLAAGCSRRAAARYVGCLPSAITATAAREKKFRHELQRSEQRVELGYIKNIQEAAKKSQYWRAAAWALERHNPEDYVARSPNTYTLDQVQQILNQFVEIIIGEIPSPAKRKGLLNRLYQLMAEHGIEERNLHDAS